MKPGGLGLLALEVGLLTVGPACGGLIQSVDGGTQDGGPVVDVELPLDVQLPSDAQPSSDVQLDTGIVDEGLSDSGDLADSSSWVDAGGCDPATLGWSPLALSGLVVWLDAADLPLGAAVSEWRDRSTASNDATQQVAAYQPTAVPGAIDGEPAVRFDGKQDLLSIADAPSLEWGTADYTILVVAVFSSSLGNTNQMLFEKTTADPPWNGAQLYVNSDKPAPNTTVSSQVSEFAFVTSARNGLDGAPHLFGGRRMGTTIEVRVDGLSEGTATVTPIVDISDPGRAVMIGQNGWDHTPGFQAVEGDIAEIVAVQGSLSDGDLQTLECHLLLKYGL